MPRYFFNTYDSRHRPDPEGTILPDLASAQAEAVILAGYLLQDHPRDVLRTEGWHLTVTDVSGNVLFRLDVSTKSDQAREAKASNVYVFRWPSA